ncbi:hypothetical protein AAEO56_01050 [Flavobacterium sp. DGU11]|uniref:Uncharacterized protein n=1 Tax=Flavobacterium arundinis TaxID=3139143 RepID=A0ABU9HSD7_9FLAO
MKILLVIAAFGLSSFALPGNSSEIKTLNKVEVDIRAYRATKSSGEGASDLYFNSVACRATFLAANPNYFANGGAMLPPYMVLTCM